MAEHVILTNTNLELSRRPIACANNGRLWFFFYNNDLNKAQYKYSDDKGETWSANTDFPTLDATLVTITVDATDKLHVAYNRPTTTSIYYRSWTSAGGWSGQTTVKTYTANEAANASSVGWISLQGTTPWISVFRVNLFWDYYLELLKTDGTTEQVAMDTTTCITGAEAAFDDSGNAVIPYARAHHLKYAKRSSTGVWTRNLTITSTGNQSYIVVGIDDNDVWNLIASPRSGITTIERYYKTSFAGNGGWQLEIVKTEVDITEAKMSEIGNKYIIIHGKRDLGQKDVYKGIKNGTWTWTKVKDNGQYNVLFMVWDDKVSLNRWYVLLGYTTINDYHILTGVSQYVYENVYDGASGSDEVLSRKFVTVEDAAVGGESITAPLFIQHDITIDDEVYLRPEMYQGEDITIDDSFEYRQILHPSEDIVLSDEVEMSTTCQYVRWILNIPLNPNFSFEDYTDGYTLENIIVAKHNESYRYHCLDLTFAGGSGVESYLSFQATVLPNTRYRIWTDFKKLSENFTISIYSLPNMTLLKEFDSTNSHSEWNYYDDTFYMNNYTTVLIKIESEYAHIYLDNLAIIEMPQIRNPQSFEVSYQGQQLGAKTLNGQNIVDVMNYNEKFTFPLSWVVLTYFPNEYLKTLRNRKALIRTHDMKSFPIEVDNIRTDIAFGFEKKKQRYNTTINCHVY